MLEGPCTAVFFFHECGRRVGGVPRSSLKGKETQHDEGEKNTSNPKTKQNPPFFARVEALCVQVLHKSP